MCTFRLPAVEENIYKSRTVIRQPLTERK